MPEDLAHDFAHVRFADLPRPGGRHRAGPGDAGDRLAIAASWPVAKACAGPDACASTETQAGAVSGTWSMPATAALEGRAACRALAGDPWHLAAWALIVAVTLLDVGYALAHRETFATWERNPVARWAAGLVGVSGIVAWRLGWTAAAALGAALVPSARRSATLILAAVHAALLVVYLLAFAKGVP